MLGGVKARDNEVWWCTFLVPVIGRLKKDRGHLGLSTEFKDNLDYSGT